jgi:hypothetical protein
MNGRRVREASREYLELRLRALQVTSREQTTNQHETRVGIPGICGDRLLRETHRRVVLPGSKLKSGDSQFCVTGTGIELQH